MSSAIAHSLVFALERRSSAEVEAEPSREDGVHHRILQRV
jgi:hypothetical protein